MAGEGSARKVLASSVGAVMAAGHPAHPKTRQLTTWHFLTPASAAEAAAAVAMGASAGAEAGAAADGPDDGSPASLLLRDCGGADAVLFALMDKGPPLTPDAAARPWE